MSVLDDVKKMIVDGCGIDAATIYRDFVPSEPDQVVSLLGYGGSGPEYDMLGTTINSIIALTHRVQVQVRGEAAEGGYDAAKVVADNVWANVFGVEVEVNGNLYHEIRPSQTPFLLDRDSARRPSFAWNVEIMAAH